MAATLPRAARLRIVHATRTMVIARGEDDGVLVFLSTPVGWRMRTQAGRPIGELVVDPGVIAQLDIAAVAA